MSSSKKKGRKRPIWLVQSVSRAWSSLLRTTTRIGPTPTLFSFSSRSLSSYLFTFPPPSFPDPSFQNRSQIRGHRVHQRAPRKGSVLRWSAGRRPRNQRREFEPFPPHPPPIFRGKKALEARVGIVCQSTHYTPIKCHFSALFNTFPAPSGSPLSPPATEDFTEGFLRASPLAESLR